MGLAHLQLAKLKGAAPVIITEMNQVRLQKARDMGADYAIDAGAEDAVAAVKAVTNGRGADYVIEAVGSIPTYRQAFDMVRRGGTLVAYGAAPSTASLISNRSISTAGAHDRRLLCRHLCDLAGGHRTDSGGLQPGRHHHGDRSTR